MILLKKIERSLTRPKSVLYLFALLISSLLIGVLLPQKPINPESYFSQLAASQPTLYSVIDFFSLHSYFNSPIFLAIIVVLLIALLLTVFKQFRGLRITRQHTETTAPYKYSTVITLEEPIEEFGRQITSKLANTLGGWKIHINQTSIGPRCSYVLRKNKIGRLASPLLHFGILILILVSFYGYLFHSRGFLQIMEGETVSGPNPGWFEEDKGLLAKEIEPPFTLKLNRLTIEYWNDFSQKKVSSNLTLRDHHQAAPTTINLRQGSPIHYDGLTIFQTNHFGYVVTLIVKPPDKAGIPTHFMFPTSQLPDRPVQAKEDFPLTEYIFELSLTPDINQSSFLLNAPELSLSIVKKEAIVFNGTLSPGEKIQFDGNDLYCASINYWAGITMITGYAMPMLYVSFFLICAGVFLQYFIFPRSLFLLIERVTKNSYNVSYRFGETNSDVFSQKDQQIVANTLQEFAKLPT